MSRSLQRAAGQRLRALLAKTTDTPLRGMLTGIGITAVLQSSSAVTVILVGFVGAGLMELRQAIPVVFGANIGTTVTAQILSFQLEELRYPFLIGGLLLSFVFQKGKGHCMGEAVFGFGLLLEGILVMGEAFEPLMQGAFLSDLLQKVSQKPFLGLLTGLCMTLTVQSSSATIAILQRVAAMPSASGLHSLIGLQGALPVLLGDNIGTTITAVLAALPGGQDAKRLAAAHACFNLSGAVIFMLFLPQFVQAVECISPRGTELEIISHQIANAHTLFNLVCGLVWLPFAAQMERFVCWLLPEKHSKA